MAQRHGPRVQRILASHEQQEAGASLQGIQLVGGHRGQIAQRRGVVTGEQIGLQDGVLVPPRRHRLQVPVPVDAPTEDRGQEVLAGVAERDAPYVAQAGGVARIVPMGPVRDEIGPERAQGSLLPVGADQRQVP